MQYSLTYILRSKKIFNNTDLYFIYSIYVLRTERINLIEYP